MGKVTNFPQPEYLLTCKYCGEHFFYIWLASADNDDFSEFECANTDCGTRFTFGDVEVFLNDD